MEIILIFLIINYLIARLLIRLTIKLSAIYIENKTLVSTIRQEQYDFYLKIYQNPSCLDNILLLHIPIYNIFSCHIVYIGILNAKNKLNK
jgi:hypothetical protein